jgi:UDPglucose 6-dehydrogenase
LSLQIDLASNPEFLKEGCAVNDFMKPDRIIIGSQQPNTQTQLSELYQPFNRNHDKIIYMSARSAELSKYAANAMLATKISFMNEVSQIAEKIGADIESVRQGIGSDPRIGFQFIYPGCGYGGSCFPKDVQALNFIAKQASYEAKLIQATHQVNEAQKYSLVEKILDYYQQNVRGKHFALWGLAFKPNTDDLREAPSLVVINELTKHGATISAYDPEAIDTAQQLFKQNNSINFCHNTSEAVQQADALIIVTEWLEFRSPDFTKLASTLKDQAIFDGRNLYHPEQVARHGLDYLCIGRQHVEKTNTQHEQTAMV